MEFKNHQNGETLFPFYWKWENKTYKIWKIMKKVKTKLSENETGIPKTRKWKMLLYVYSKL